MTIFYQGNPSVFTDLGKMAPYWLNAQLVKDVLELIHPMVEKALPMKRSGFTYDVYALFQACVEISQSAPENVGKWLNQSCINSEISFQNFEKEKFTNGKNRRYFPDQPGLSRAFNELADADCTEKYWNLVLFAHLLILRKQEIINSEITLIADFTTEHCEKNKADPYCFGTKEGKTVHKTLTFSIISNGIHQVVANYKIKKRENKVQFFEEVIKSLQNQCFSVKYTLVDREFYRKQLFLLFREKKITVIMPGRNCNLTRQKVEKYIQGKGTRYCKGFIKLAYIKGIGYPAINFDLLLVSKRKYKITDTIRHFKNGTLTLDKSCKQIFPLIVFFGNSRGVTRLRGNETYIRDLYRLRWEIEIAFREMNRFGIKMHIQNRNIRLGIMGAKSLLYNMWQVQRNLINKENPTEKPLELNEFLGKTPIRRYRAYLKVSV